MKGCLTKGERMTCVAKGKRRFPKDLSLLGCDTQLHDFMLVNEGLTDQKYQPKQRARKRKAGIDARAILSLYQCHLICFQLLHFQGFLFKLISSKSTNISAVE